ncbi:MAG: hypothetical protein LBD37_03165 [Treponema sp.]|jgi:hypothetical protein|nr:hypothetical protein [Treponema sp.]
MDICINGQPADITLDSERTMGELLSGMEDWLRSSGYRLKGLEIDGESITGNAVPEVFNRDLQGIHSVNIKVCPQTELILDALQDARECLEAYTAAPPNEKRRIQEDWQTSAASSFLRAENPELFKLINGGLTGRTQETGLAYGPETGALTVVDERIRELKDPREEYARMESLVGGITGRLEELPLDIQTGKDKRAAETVSLFSGITEKIFRLFVLLQSKMEGIDALVIDSIPVYTFLEEFCAALKELLAAYESKDVVLVGDLAEYELAPRLRTFYAAIKASVVSLV